MPDFTVRDIAYPSQPTSNNSVEAPFMYWVQLSYIRETPVYDIAARVFARAFYLALLAGKIVKQAFDIGKAAVDNLPDLPAQAHESEKFLLLPEYGYHDVAIFAGAQYGEWRDVTPQQCPNNLPAIPENFIGRNLNMQQVINSILIGRLITLRGAPGIGKTALAKAAACYINERRLFRDGVFFVPLRGVKSAEEVRFAVANALEITARDDKELFTALRKQHILLVLDNCEDPLHYARNDFRMFLSQLLQTAQYIRLPLTSRETVGGGLPGVAEKIKALRHLNSLDSARLFMALAPRPLTNNEIGTDDPDKAIVILSRHPILDFLSGHPHAISLAVPLLQEKSLNQLYELLRKQKVDALQVAGVVEDEKNAINSFATSLGVSVNYMRQTNPNAVRLFAVMGLLPAGALDKDLDAIWCDDWQPLMEALVRSSLVERVELGNMEHFSTFPFITAYAESLLTDDDRSLFAIRACEHFSEMSESISQMMGTDRASTAFALLALEEGNLRACLDIKHPSRPKREDEEISPTALIAANLPKILLFAYRADDGIQAAKLGYKACRALSETFGEANCRQGYGNLLMAEGKYDEALNEFLAAFQIHIQIKNILGVGAALGYMGRAATGAKRNNIASVLFERALSIHSAIMDRYGQALDLESLGNALWVLEVQDGAVAAWWQAREIFRAIQSPSASRLDGLFTQLEKAAGKRDYQVMITDLQGHAEERWREAVGALLKETEDDPFLLEIRKLLTTIKL